MTVGNPVRLIIQFMIPMFLGNVFQQFYNIVDSIVAGQFIGVDALAAIGSTGSLMFFVTGWLNGLSSGFAIIVAQRFGAKKYEDMRHFVAMSIYLMMGFAVAMTIGFLVFNIPILRLMNSPAELMDDVAGYMGIIYAGLLVTAAYNTLAAFLRALGDSKSPLYFLIISLNAIGLQNPGIDLFCKRDIPFLKQYDTKIIVNVCGKSTEDYCEVVERLADEPVDLLEINVSCPNVKEGGIAFGQDPHALEAITKEVKKYAKQPIIMKLSPNVTDITEMAKAAEAGGADILSLINTLTGMKIDIYRRTFALANKTGGMSGPAVKPVAVRMVYQVAQAVKLPIIGMGGIATAEDALEFIMAGATAVSVGTANFFNPYATVEIAEGIEKFMAQQKVEDINQLIGIVK